MSTVQLLPVRGGLYRHYKGGHYVVLGVALDEEAMPARRLRVNYRHLGDEPLTDDFGRQLAVWSQEVEHEGTTVPRFVLVGVATGVTDALRGVDAMTAKLAETLRRMG